MTWEQKWQRKVEKRRSDESEGEVECMRRMCEREGLPCHNLVCVCVRERGRERERREGGINSGGGGWGGHECLRQEAGFFKCC